MDRFIDRQLDKFREQVKQENMDKLSKLQLYVLHYKVKTFTGFLWVRWKLSDFLYRML